MMKLVRIKTKNEYILLEPEIEIDENGNIGGMCLAVTDKSLLPPGLPVGLITKDKIDQFILEDETTNVWDVEIDHDLNIYLKDQLV